MYVLQLSFYFFYFLHSFKQRNKPKEAPKVPKMAPFFLPTISDVNGFKFDLSNENGQNNNNMKSKISAFTSINMFFSEFGNSILKSENSQNCEIPFYFFFSFIFF